MADVIKRLKYYNGQFLQEPDFTAEQDYHLDRQRRHNRMLHTPGIADGLAVTANASSTSAAVAPGTALDSQGRQIVLHESRTIGFSGSLHGKTALVVIAYAEEEADDATVGDAGKTRWKEVPRIEAILDDGLPLGDRIPLGRLQIAANGTIASHDPSVRLPAGARVRPDEIFDRLRLSRPPGGGQSPVLTSGASGRLDLTGDLNVTGNILVGGTVDGRDVSADGALNETHRGRADNPHNVTATQVGALTSLAGVSNPGGNIDLIGQSGITVTGNDANNTITIASGAPATIDGVSSPGGNIDFLGSNGIAVTANNVAKTITFAGNAPATIDGVSSPNGNIDFVGQGISIMPDNTGKLIAFSTNPGTIGALAAADYLKRYRTWSLFGTSAANGALSPFNIGFTPKVIIFHTTVHGDFSGFKQTAVLSGMATVSSNGSYSVLGSKTNIVRTTGAPYWKIEGTVGWGGYIARVDFKDEAPFPIDRHTALNLVLAEVNATGFVIRLEKSTNTIEVPCYTEFQFTALG